MIVAFIGDIHNGKSISRRFFNYLKDLFPFRIHYLDESKLAKVYSGYFVNYIPFLAVYEKSLNDIVLINANLKFDDILTLETLCESPEKINTIFIVINDYAEFPVDLDYLFVDTTKHSDEEISQQVINYYIKCQKTF